MRGEVNHDAVVGLRHRGQPLFQFATEVSDDDETEIEFTDDAGCRWSLTSGLHLSPLESSPAQATSAEELPQGPSRS